MSDCFPRNHALKRKLITAIAINIHPADLLRVSGEYIQHKKTFDEGRGSLRESVSRAMASKPTVEELFKEKKIFSRDCLNNGRLFKYYFRQDEGSLFRRIEVQDCEDRNPKIIAYLVNRAFHGERKPHFNLFKLGSVNPNRERFFILSDDVYTVGKYFTFGKLKVPSDGLHVIENGRFSLDVFFDEKDLIKTKEIPINHHLFNSLTHTEIPAKVTYVVPKNTSYFFVSPRNVFFKFRIIKETEFSKLKTIFPIVWAPTKSVEKNLAKPLPFQISNDQTTNDDYYDENDDDDDDDDEQGEVDGKVVSSVAYATVTGSQLQQLLQAVAKPIQSVNPVQTFQVPSRSQQTFQVQQQQPHQQTFQVQQQQQPPQQTFQVQPQQTFQVQQQPPQQTQPPLQPAESPQSTQQTMTTQQMSYALQIPNLSFDAVF